MMFMPEPEAVPDRYTTALIRRRYEENESAIRRWLETQGWGAPKHHEMVKQELECFIDLTYAMALRLPADDPMRKDAMEALYELAEDEPDLLPFHVSQELEP